MTTGTRVRLAMPKVKAAWGAKYIDRYAGHSGKVVGHWLDGECLRVKWDHLMDLHVIHPKYLEPMQ